MMLHKKVMPTPLKKAYQDALADQGKLALTMIVSRNPKAPIQDLARLVQDNPELSGVTLGDLFEAGGGRKRGKGKTSGGGSKGGGKRNVRTEAGREAFDAEVLEALKALGGDTIAATDLRASLGADSTQLRTSLNRLIEKGLVTFTGKARGTRYSLAS